MALDWTGKWNPGGGLYVDVVPLVAVAAFSRSTVALPPTITLRDGWSWTRIYCTPGTLAYKLDQTETENGLLFPTAVRGFHPGDSAQQALDMSRLAGYRRHLVRFRDNTGTTRVAGSQTEALLFTYQFGTAEDVPGDRGYTISLQGDLTQSPSYE